MLAFPLSGLANLRDGAEGARTPDLVTASHALSQLSYSPKRVIAGHLNTHQLTVSRGGEAKMGVRAALELVDP